MRTWAWVSFWILAFIWGSSFLLIRVGVGVVSPAQLVFIRTAVAAIGLNVVLLLRGKRLPTDWQTIRALALIGVGNATIPYYLLALGEQSIESNVASVLQATASMFTLVIAHFFLPDERMTRKKVLGLLLGFFGVLILASRAEQGGEANALPGMLAVVAASSFYATFIVYSKKVIQGKIEPMVIAAGSFIASAASAFVLLLLEPAFGGRAPVMLNTLTTDSLLALFMLGFLNTFIAYMFFYYIVQQLGAFRASNVTYIVPVIGVILGWLVLDEAVDIRLALGAALILSGITVINVRFAALRLRPVPQGGD